MAVRSAGRDSGGNLLLPEHGLRYRLDIWPVREVTASPTPFYHARVMYELMAQNKRRDFSAVFILILFIALLAALIPAIFIAQESPENNAFEQDEGNITTVRYPLEGELLQVTQSQVEIRVYNRDSGVSVNSTMLDEGQSESLQLGDNTITVTNHEILTSNRAIIGYEYPLYIGWPDGAKLIIENISAVLIIMLALFAVALFLQFGRGK